MASTTRAGLAVLMRRSAMLGSWFLLALCVVALAAGCAGSRTTAAQPAKTSVAVLQFGPVYTVKQIGDPVVARTVRGDAIDPYHLRSFSKTPKAPAVSAEIRGYLVDWAIRDVSSSTIYELAVMKDGTLYRLSGQRPAAAFGAVPPARLTPEPAAEAKARIAAVAVARAAVAKRFPAFAAVVPVVYNYLVRIHRTDGTSTDVWVDPDVYFGRFFYNIGLRKLRSL